MEVVEQVSVTVLPGGLVSRRDAAACLGRKPKTLAGWAESGKGPEPVNVAGRVFYRLAELETLTGSPIVAAA